jgi:hypothetical protein
MGFRFLNIKFKEQLSGGSEAVAKAGVIFRWQPGNATIGRHTDLNSQTAALSCQSMRLCQAMRASLRRQQVILC